MIQDKNTLAPMGSTRPTFIWEPVPDSCVPEELQNFNEAIRYVDVVSPNELELRNLLGHANSERSKGGDQALVDIIMESGIGPEGRGILVVRAGREGCYAYYQGQILALPAYLATVVDPTGAGNAFLGALAQALISAGRMPMTAIKSSLMKSDSWIDMSGAWAEHAEWAAALICAIVAASFVVEQAGVPQVSISKDGEELWNGMNYTERVQLYAKQLIEVLETLEKPHALRT